MAALGVSKVRLEQPGMVEMSLPMKGWNEMSLKVSFIPNHSRIL